ncbi:exoribonuclease II [Buchnera aphidicola]|uniref:exoribonuclease II n=1 Tax=Buchnera aphidicola TaxID=9 RepID=UPI00346444BE
MFQNNRLLIPMKMTCKLKSLQISGIVKKFKKGFGFLKVTSKINYYIPPKYNKYVMHGDRIVAELYYQNGKKFVRPIILIKPFLKIFMGYIKKIGNNVFIKPDYPLISNLIICDVKKNNARHIHDRDWFIAKLIQHQLNNGKIFQARLITLISSYNDPLLPWKVVLSNHKTNYKFPNIYNYEINFNKKIFRKNLIHLNFITIDHECTKDIDDALYVKKHDNDDITIIIAISDPTAYINIGSNLDVIASKMLFTNYLPGFNIPMLPRILSENKFSLHPNVKKPVLACKVVIDKYGNINKNFNFFLAWIKSHARLTYEDVEKLIEGNRSWYHKTSIINQINVLHELCNRRMKWRKKNAVIFKDKIEYKFHFSSSHELIKVTFQKRGIAHKIVEETMILANIIASKFISKNLGFGVYNSHIGFNETNAKNVSLILKNNGIYINSNNITTLLGFCEFRRILNTISTCYIESCIQKYQSFSVMSLTPKPHFALGFNEYLTWTSPIRKYSDMINHRIIKSIILGNSAIKPNQKMIMNIMDCKRRHRTIKKNIENWLYINFFYKTKKINQIFQAKIFDILPYGIRAQLIINGANVFIPMCHIHHVQKEIICNQKYGILYLKNKELYRISDNISVIIIDIQFDSRSIIAKPI